MSFWYYNFAEILDFKKVVVTCLLGNKYLFSVSEQFRYSGWELTGQDLDEEEEDNEAAAAEEADEEEEEEEVEEEVSKTHL